jgi:hypothetical protein
MRTIRLLPLMGVVALSAAPAAMGLPPIAASASTPTIVLHVGHSVTYAKARWLPDQRVTCSGDGDVLHGMIPGIPTVGPLARMAPVGRTLTLRYNHGLKITSLESADGSLTLTCSPYTGRITTPGA